MRFSTVAAFMLPFTALAAPVPEPVHKDSDWVSDNSARLEQLRQGTLVDVGTLNGALFIMPENGRKIQEGSNKDGVNQIVNKANQVLSDWLVTLVDTANKIAVKIQGGDPTDLPEYVATPMCICRSTY